MASEEEIVIILNAQLNILADIKANCGALSEGERETLKQQLVAANVDIHAAAQTTGVPY